jgi:hypothetical protein
MKQEDYPFYKVKIPNDKKSLIKGIKKMGAYWEKLTTRNQDIQTETTSISKLKRSFKWYVSKEAAKLWLEWKPSKKRSSKNKECDSIDLDIKYLLSI